MTDLNSPPADQVPPRPASVRWAVVLRRPMVLAVATAYVLLGGVITIDFFTTSPAHQQPDQPLLSWVVGMAVLTGGLIGTLQEVRRSGGDRIRGTVPAVAAMALGGMPLGGYLALTYGLAYRPWGLLIGLILTISGLRGWRKALGRAVDPFAELVDLTVLEVKDTLRRRQRTESTDQEGK